MTGARRRHGGSRAHIEAESWLPAALTRAALTHEPNTAEIRGRMARAAGGAPAPGDRACAPHASRQRARSAPRGGLRSRLSRSAWPFPRRPTMIVIGMATGMLSIAAITLIGVRAIPPFDDRRPITAIAAPAPSTSASPHSPALPASPTNSPLDGPDQAEPAAAPLATNTTTPATPRATATTSIINDQQIAISSFAIPAQTIILPLRNCRDWVLYGLGNTFPVREQARADLRNPLIGQLGIVGASPTAVTGTRGRFDWSGGRPQATGRDYTGRLAVPGSGELKLTVSLAAAADGHLDLYLGTLGVRGEVQATLDGQPSPPASLVAPQAGRWADTVVRISFGAVTGPRSLTVTVSAAAGDRDGDGQFPGFQHDGGTSSRWPPGAVSSGQISLAAAVLLED
ncbi:hypothetical protein [Frankia sp. Cj5]|uniref:hypothetical protein n=2 Tax=unclassified Frankia TaxID=2632575 RepID=UPI001EF70D23|nr:hypothetical protein [Frankia sp. Cj5]